MAPVRVVGLTRLFVRSVADKTKKRPQSVNAIETRRPVSSLPNRSRCFVQPQLPRVVAKQYACRFLSSSDTTTASISTQDRFVSLEQQSRSALIEDAASPCEHSRHCEQLITDWYTLLPHLNSDSQHEAIARMHDLLPLCTSVYCTTNQPLQLALAACAGCHVKHHGSTALSILHMWHDRWGGDLAQAPDRQAYEHVLRAYSSENSLEAAHVAIEITQQLEQWGYTMTPSVTTYALAVQCVGRMLLQQRQHSDRNVNPEIEELAWQLYDDLMSRLVNLVAEKKTVMTAEMQEEVMVAIGVALQCCNTESQASLPSAWFGWAQQWVQLVASSSFYEVDSPALAILDLCTKQLEVSGEEKKLFTLMDEALQEVQRQGEALVFSSTQHYHMALKALQRRSHDDAQSFQRTWLDALDQQRYISIAKSSQGPQNDDALFLFDAGHWNHLMSAYYCAKRYASIEKVWKHMTSTRGIPRDTFSYALILKTLAAQGNAERAHAILRRMLAVDRDRRHVQPTVQHFGSVLVAWSRAASLRKQPGVALAACDQVMQAMKTESQHDPHLQPALMHYEALVRSMGQPEEKERLLETIDTMQQKFVLNRSAYSSIFAALARVGTEETAKFAESLLDEMEKSSSVSPTREYYQSIMLAWARSGSANSIHRCEWLLERLQEQYLASGKDASLLPNASCYISLIRASASQSLKDDPMTCGRRAEEVLDRMTAAVQKGIAEPPNRNVYTAVMQAYVSNQETAIPRDAVKRVENIFQRMTGHPDATPDAFSIGTVISAWSNSDAEDRAENARAILDSMRDKFDAGLLDFKPDHSSFSNTLRACTKTAKTAKDNSILTIATNTLNEMYDYVGGPTDIDFAVMFQIIGYSRHLDEKERLDLASATFQKCCNDGYVSQKITHVLHQFFPRLYYKLPLNKEKRVGRLPVKWTRSLDTEYTKDKMEHST